jgi:hypothetical protein
VLEFELSWVSIRLPIAIPGSFVPEDNSIAVPSAIRRFRFLASHQTEFEQARVRPLSSFHRTVRVHELALAARFQQGRSPAGPFFGGFALATPS